MTAIRRIALLFFIARFVFVKTEREECSSVDCSGFAIPICSSDSILVQHDTESCCPSDVTCECDKSHCAKFELKCDPGMQRVQVRKGTTIPGQCCDQFECRLIKYCDPSACPKQDVADLHSLSDTSCPEDSYRPPSYVADECCLITPDCRCKASICEPVRCSNDEVVVIDKRGDGVPGRCCDKFHCELKQKKSDCFVNGVYYHDGEQWNINDSSCETCLCTNGVKLCRKMECQPVTEHCTWIGITDGNCCPICLGCKEDDGRQYSIGEDWIKDDCTNCTCDESFKSSCQRSLCSLSCENPRKVKGQCCPVCDAPLVVIIDTPQCPSVDLCTLRCEFGLSRNQWGCFQCECAKEFHPDYFHPISESAPTNCPDVTKTCKKQCAHGYLTDENNCPICKCANCPHIDQCYKQCLYGFETNSLGCPVCKCRFKNEIDSNQNISKDQNGACVSKDKRDGALIERDSGEWWADNTCRQCFCQQQTEFCSLITCPKRPMHCPIGNWITKPNDCCPSCNIGLRHQISNEQILTVCHSPGNGRLFVDGETWKLDACISCTCRVGHVLCSSKQCPPIPCENSIEDPNDYCCKICPRSDISDIIHVNIGYCIDKQSNSHPIHSTWREDDCRSCSCSEDGTVRCYEEKCRLLDFECTDRVLMVKGQCCEVCSDSLGGEKTYCTYKDNTYVLEEKFRDGQCRNCTCKLRGIVECVERQCPYCEEPLYSPNSCCPLCQDKNAYLLEGNGQTVFLDNQIGYFVEPMTIYLLLIGIALMILCSFVLLSVYFGKCFYKSKKPVSNNKTNTTTALNKRTVSDCESANSLLSSETNNVSLSPATSLIVHSERIPNIPPKYV